RARRAARLRSRTSRSTSTHAGRNAEASSSASLVRSVNRSAAGASAIGSERGRVIEAMAVQIAETGGFTQKDQLDRAGLAVPVLGDDQLGQTLLVRVVLVVHLVSIDERDHVCVLLDRPRLAKVRKLRPVVAPPPLRGSRELGERDHRQL